MMSPPSSIRLYSKVATVSTRQRALMAAESFASSTPFALDLRHSRAPPVPEQVLPIRTKESASAFRSSSVTKTLRGSTMIRSRGIFSKSSSCRSSSSSTTQPAATQKVALSGSEQDGTWRIMTSFPSIVTVLPELGTPQRTSQGEFDYFANRATTLPLPSDPYWPSTTIVTDIILPILVLH